jgi:chorismate-pyruvate lyase
MKTGVSKPHNDSAAAHAALGELLRPFLPPEFGSECDLVQADAIPSPADMLLVHHNHMTVQLERHHRCAVEVRVIAERHEYDVYSRLISLNLVDSGRVVEYGIARLNLRHLSPAVQAEVLSKQTPLGSILIQHNVHRRVKPRFFVRFPAFSRIMNLFHAGSLDSPVYGRLGTIYCNNEPAIQLLETVVNTEVQENP